VGESAKCREAITCACGCGAEKLKYRSMGRLASPYVKGHCPRLQKSDDVLYPSGSRRCPGCKKTKLLMAFGRSRDDNGRVYIRSRCKTCTLRYQKSYASRLGDDFRVMRQKAKTRFRKKDPVRYFIQNTIARYRAATPDSDLTTEYLETLWYEQSGLCALTGTPMVVGGRGRGRPECDSASLDRIDPPKGYVKGNVAWCSYQANTSKGARSLTEFHAFCKLVLERANV
jgi:hypothetical protein